MLSCSSKKRYRKVKICCATRNIRVKMDVIEKGENMNKRDKKMLKKNSENEENDERERKKVN